MKKIYLIVFFSLTGMILHAQHYFGGSLSIYENSIKNSNGKKIGLSNFNFSISPELGNHISEKIDVGISIGLLVNNRKSYQFTPGEMNAKNITTGLNASPYIRYSFFRYGNFDILGKLALNFTGNTTKYYDINGKETDKFSSNIIGMNLAPLLFYNFSECFALYTQLNFLGLDCSSTTEKTGNRKTGSTQSFTFGVNTDNLTSFDKIRIGFVKKFR